jgi:hypothetical protein
MGPVIASPAVPSPRSGPTLRARAWQHALWTLLPFGLVWLYCAWDCARQPPGVSPTGLPHQRLLWYREHRNEFDLLWLGDSRTYCAMDPDLDDPLLERRSMNMSIFGLWLPAQWAFFEDLMREVPPGTAVCWSVGHINFNPQPKNLDTMYPLGVVRTARYLALGYRWADVRGNLYNFATSLELPRRAAAWHDGIDHFLAVPLRKPRPAPPAAEEPAEVRTLRTQAEALQAQLLADPAVNNANIVSHDGRPTSVEAYTKHGAYRRFELDEAFFRGKQAETAAKVRAIPSGDPAPYEPDPLFWATFEKILDVMAASGRTVIVNELEEAPHCYPTEKVRESVRLFMRQRVRQAVESRGLVYVRADLDRLGDEDYFDYNHLNTRGAAHYAPLLAAVLRPHLHRD